MKLLRYFPFLLRDRARRFYLLMAAGAVILGPMAIGLRLSAGEDAVARGFRDGLAAAGGNPLFSLLSWVLLGGALLLFEGVVARERRDGTYRPLLARPVSRTGYFAGAWLASLTLLLACALLFGGFLDWAGAPLGLPRVLGAGLVLAALAGWVVGSVIFAVSTRLDRGDALLTIALIIAPVGLANVRSGWFAPEAPAGRILRSLFPPMSAVADAADAVLAGGFALEPTTVAFVYGAVFFTVGVLVLRFGEFRTR